MQHRVAWSDHGGTWGLPGGARLAGEDPITAAIRESGEEAGVPEAAVAVAGWHRFDVGYWSYTTVFAEVVEAEGGDDGEAEGGDAPAAAEGDGEG